jgi:predicted SnoaL-like aldol condensation-catalyzing enzyme
MSTQDNLTIAQGIIKKGDQLMSTEQNKATAGRWFSDIIAHGQLAVADEIFAANHIIHDPHAPPGGWPNGPEGLKMVASGFGGGFSDWDITLADQIAEGDMVATRWIARATHTGPLQGMPATGKTVRVTGVNVTRFAEGKIVESWFNFDMLTLLQQLGAIPAPEQASR